MDFTLDERQQAVAGLAAEVLTAEDPWKDLARAGLLDVSPPDGLGVLEVAVLLTVIGKRAPSMKALATLMTGALPLARWGHPALLPAVASGELLLTAALADGVALVRPDAQGVRLTRTPSSSGEPEYALELDHAPVEAMLGGPECMRDLYQLAVAGACALADGVVAGALALTRDHVASREQFGRPLAAFQAVSQQIADVYIASRT